MDAMELEINIFNTDHFIGERPRYITLVPHKKVRTNSGGYKVEVMPSRDPQRVRIIELGAAGTNPTVTTQDGTHREVNYWMLGMPDAVFEEGDRWTDQTTGRAWQVVHVMPSNGYEQRSVVEEVGR